MTPEPAIQPCPFCRIPTTKVFGDEISGYAVVCANDDCGATGPTKDTETAAVEAWNLGDKMEITAATCREFLRGLGWTEAQIDEAAPPARTTPR